MSRPKIYLAAAAVLVAAGGAVASSVPAQADAESGPHDVTVAAVADHDSVNQYQDIGFTLTISNNTSATKVATLGDELPAGGNLSWAVDAQSGATCTTSGPVGAQRLVCPQVELPGHGTYRVHVYSHTTSSTDAQVTDTATVTLGNGTRGASSAVVRVSPGASCRATPADTSRTLAFDDEFSGGSIDTAKWNVGVLPFGGYRGSTHYHNSQYGSYVQASNSYTQDGVLNLTTDNTPVTAPDVPAIGTIPYTEGMIHTKNLFSRTGGYFEICAKFPAGKGLWPAFWLAAQNGNWPPEMDIAEWFGSLEALQIGQPFATGPNAGSLWESTWKYAAEATTGFHDYAMWWSTSSPATIRYYIDGQMVHEIDGTTANLISNTPMYIILNSGTWAPASRGGPPDATTVFPNSFQVDYVRVYTTPPVQQPNSAP